MEGVNESGCATGEPLQSEELEDASIAAAAAASAATAVSAGSPASVCTPSVLEHAPHVAQAASSHAHAHSHPGRVPGVGIAAAAPFSGTPTTTSATPQTSSMGPEPPVSREAQAGMGRDEPMGMARAQPSDPLLHACFNAQLLAYSSDPALLDRSTEILMIMLECAPLLAASSAHALPRHRPARCTPACAALCTAP